MSRIRPTWTPPSINTAGLFTFGVDFSADTAITVEGVWWYQPAGTVTDITVRLYDQATQTLLASGTALAGSLLTGAWNLIPYAAAYAASAGVTYTATATVSGTHGYDDSGLPTTDPTGHVTAVQGRFQGFDGYPGSTWTGLHGLDVEFTAGETAPARGAADVGLALDLAAEGRRDSAAAGSLGLALDVAASGSRPARGVAAFALILDVVAASVAAAQPGVLTASGRPAAVLVASGITPTLTAS